MQKVRVVTEVIQQDVIVSDLLISEFRDRFEAETLTTENGVRLHFDIPWSKMQYHRHRRSESLLGELWQFSSKPFKKEET